MQILEIVLIFYLTNKEPTSIPTFICILGSGGYGDVFLGKNDQSNEQFAVKRVKRSRAGLDVATYAELLAAKLFHNENVVEVKQIYILGNQMHFAMEFCQSNIEKLYQTRLLKEERQNIYKQALNGLKYLHSMGFWVADIKPKNILVKIDKIAKHNAKTDNLNQQDQNMFDSGLYNETRTVVKISDFGLGSFINQHSYGSFCKTGPQYKHTDGYRPPEIICGFNELSLKSDVWSLGVSFLELLVGRNPFYSQSQTDTYESNYQCKLKVLFEDMINNTTTQSYEKQFDFLNQFSIDQDEREFLQDMLHFDVRYRKSARELFECQFLQNMPEILMIGQDRQGKLDHLDGTQFKNNDEDSWHE